MTSNPDGFDMTVGGYLTLFDGPGGMCVLPLLDANKSSATYLCGPDRPCTVPCASNPSALPWAAHARRGFTSVPTAFTYDPAKWSNKTWKHASLNKTAKMHQFY